MVGVVLGLDGPAMGAIDFGDVVAAGLLRALEVELLGEVGAVEGAGVAPEKRREVVGNEAHRINSNVIAIRC